MLIVDQVYNGYYRTNVVLNGAPVHIVRHARNSWGIEFIAWGLDTKRAAIHLLDRIMFIYDGHCTSLKGEAVRLAFI